MKSGFGYAEEPSRAEARLQAESLAPLGCECGVRASARLK
jgi:hypothetical protein